AVLVEDGVEPAGPPTGEHLLHGGDVDGEEIGERCEVRSQRHNETDVEVTLAPSVPALPDPGREGVVHGGVAEGALKSHRSEVPLVVEQPRDADDRVQLEKGERGRGVLEVDLAVLDSLLQWGGQGVRIHLEADGQRGLGAHAVADTSVLRAADGSVELEGLAPKRFARAGGEGEN